MIPAPRFDAEYTAAQSVLYAALEDTAQEVRIAAEAALRQVLQRPDVAQSKSVAQSLSTIQERYPGNYERITSQSADTEASITSASGSSAPVAPPPAPAPAASASTRSAAPVRRAPKKSAAASAKADTASVPDSIPSVSGLQDADAALAWVQEHNVLTEAQVKSLDSAKWVEKKDTIDQLTEWVSSNVKEGENASDAVAGAAEPVIVLLHAKVNKLAPANMALQMSALACLQAFMQHSPSGSTSISDSLVGT